MTPTDSIVPQLETNTEIGPLADIADRASDFIRESKAGNAVRGYQADWRHFSKWCQMHGQTALLASPDCVAPYLTDLSATHKPATLTRRLSAISQAHQIAGMESPARASKTRLVMAGIRRSLGTAQVAKSPVLVNDLKRMISRLPEGLIGARDRVLLPIGFCGAFRRSELVALDRDAVEITADGLVITIRRSKTDQEGVGRKIGLPYAAHREPARYARCRTGSRRVRSRKARYSARSTGMARCQRNGSQVPRSGRSSSGMRLRWASTPQDLAVTASGQDWRPLRRRPARQNDPSWPRPDTGRSIWPGDTFGMAACSGRMRRR